MTINDIKSKCMASSCDFEWLSQSTPQVTKIDVSNSNLIKINGNGFDSVMSKNLVLIGDTPCEVNFANETDLSCVPGDGPLGTCNFTVNIVGKGLATLSADALSTSFDFTLQALAISPSVSGTGGKF